jgi:hypothetical protein
VIGGISDSDHGKAVALPPSDLLTRSPERWSSRDRKQERNLCERGKHLENPRKLDSKILSQVGERDETLGAISPAKPVPQAIGQTGGSDRHLVAWKKESS